MLNKKKLSVNVLVDGAASLNVPKKRGCSYYASFHTLGRGLSGAATGSDKLNEIKQAHVCFTNLHPVHIYFVLFCKI